MCQTIKNKSKPKTQVLLQPNPILAIMWQSITMDFVTDLLELQLANSMFIVVDCSSKAIVITLC